VAEAVEQPVAQGPARALRREVCRPVLALAVAASAADVNLHNGDKVRAYGAVPLMVSA